MNTIYLNGKFTPKNKATISIMDRGFLFSDSIYEVIPVSKGKIISFKAHFDRLQQSLEAVGIVPPLSQKEWEDVLHELLVLNNLTGADASLYVQVTRGVQEYRNHAFDNSITPTFLAFCSPVKTKDIAVLKEGFHAITLPDKRHHYGSLKTTALFANVVAYNQALISNAFEVIFIREGFAVEASSSNLFIVKDNILITPPLDGRIFAGVTRDIVLQLAKQHNIAFREGLISTTALFEADEVWVTGSIKEICPIVAVDKRPIGNGKVGPLWYNVMQLYQQYKQAYPLSDLGVANSTLESRDDL